MVGGGTVHWQGWLPRFTPEDFRLHTIVGDLQGATLADWPISYDDLEPYYTKVEWAFGVSGQAGANAYEGPRSKGYPCPPLPLSRYAQKFHEGCRNAGLERLPDPAGRAVPAVQRPPGDGDQRLRPAARRPDRHPVQRAQRLHPGRTGHRPIRPAAGKLRPGTGRRRRGQGHAPRSTRTRPARHVEQEADVFILACGAVETARLMLLSKSGALSERPRQRQRPGRPQRHLPRVQLRDRDVRRPDLRLGRWRLRQRQFDGVLQPRRFAGVSSAAVTSPAPE